MESDPRQEKLSAKAERAQARAQKLAAKTERLAAKAGDVIGELAERRARHVVKADQPMVLIAQTNRSGGTLLSQLLDGHPQLHVHPWELETGAKTEPWPELDLTAPETWRKHLHERHIGRAYEVGYSKDKASHALGHNEQERFPFLLPQALQARLFELLAPEWEVETQRDVLDLHFTSYFNAWLDNQNLYGSTKLWHVAFRGRLRRPENLTRFFRDYPDGRHITIMRDAKGNIASRLNYRPRDDEGAAVERAIRSWQRSAELQLAMKRRYRQRMLLLTFDRLVTDTEETMRAVAEWLGLRFDPILLEPTFNRMPIRASSHFRVEGHGVRREPLEHWRQVLSNEKGTEIDRRTADLFDRYSRYSAEDVAWVRSHRTYAGR